MLPNRIGIISAHGYQPNRKTSLEATEWLEYLNNCVFGCSIEHGRNGKEAKIGNCFVDGIDRTTNTIYEYNGCVHHGCPDCTNPTDRTPFRQITMVQAYEETERKRHYLENCGFQIETMWTHDWFRLKSENDQVKEFVENLTLGQPLLPQDAFCGGRTNASVLKYNCGENEKIHHLDVISLYPAVNKKDPYPLYHPEIILKDFRNVKDYFGFVKCRVLAPDQDHFPILPMKIDKKLIFPLCSRCAGVKNQFFCSHSDKDRALSGIWCTPELHFAMDNGYKILEVYEVWHWTHRKTGMFADYIDTFLKEKVEASGWPAWVKVSKIRKVT